MIKKYCKDCKYWPLKYVTRSDGEIDLKDKMRSCSNPDLNEGESDLIDFWTVDVADFKTSAEFGCVLFEPREVKE